MAQRNDRQELARAVMDLIDTGHRRISRKLDLVRIKVLATVTDRAPVRPGELATELALTSSAVSRHLAALEDAGQIELTVDPADARTFLARPTSAGRQALQAATDAGTAAFTSVIADWTDKQVEATLQAVELLNTTWADHHAAGDGPRAPTSQRQARRRQR
ncbi:MarR family winged helix-turn-helix transcriptional regulator [Kribbella sp. DT2]|uniref:MarR family winged helix-turn-helix transcriptional regulator n=1 Tax=Kribbella sp. DT2 TaxID=3393427 RepID=UPI003CFAEE01